MQKYRNKYEEVFQQLYQYDAFAVNTNKNIVKKNCVRTDRFRDLLSEIFQNYIRLCLAKHDHSASFIRFTVKILLSF